MELSIRRATVEDAAALLEMERGCPEAPHWSEPVWARILAQGSQYDPLSSLDGPQRTCLVAAHAGDLVGFLVLSVAGSAESEGSLAEMESLAVTEGARRRGVGRSLCLQAMLQARTMGAQSMELEVRSASVAALSLYRSLGFVEQGRRRGYYRDPPDDAVLMAVALL